MLRPRIEAEFFFKRLKRNVIIFTVIIAAGFMILTLRLWHLQVAQHELLAHRAENNRIRQKTLDGLRGKIFDRHGTPLVENRPSFELALTPEDVENPEEELAFLATRVKIDPEIIIARIKKSKPFERVIIKRDISRADVAFIEEHRNRLPGIYLEVRPIRNYIYGDLAPHLLGYLGTITPAQLSLAPPDTYSRTDSTGHYGVEKIFEASLRGGKGKKMVEVDAAGRQLNLLGLKPPKSGADLYLSIDLTTQVAASEAFKGRMGAVVAIDPNNGDILAIISRPAFDSNAFAFGISAPEWSALLKNEFNPLQNRAVQGQYPPGSTFKVVVAAAGLEEKIIDENTTIFCPGHFKLGNRSYRCWKKGGHGKMNIHTALVQSCDVFFYQLGVWLGVDTIARYAKMFGLGDHPGSSFESEKSGLIPTKAWKEKAKNERWIPGETVSTAIGQGFVLTTPLQMARLVATIANGGKLVTPNLLRRRVDTVVLSQSPDSQEGARPADKTPLAESKIHQKISAYAISVIQNAMRGVISEPHGTGWRLKHYPFDIAGKTGTSQVIRMKKDEKAQKEGDGTPFKFRDHSLFIAYAPFDHPKIAIAVIAEHSGHGGSVAAPIAGKIIDAYLSGLSRQKGVALPKTIYGKTKN